MKKYMVFLISFVTLFIVFQVLSGYFTTLFYTPDIPSAWSQAGSLSSSVVMKDDSFLFPFMFACIALLIAYFMTRLFVKWSNK